MEYQVGVFCSGDELQQLVAFCLLGIPPFEKLLESNYLFALLLPQSLQLPDSFLPHKQFHLSFLVRSYRSSLFVRGTTLACLGWVGRLGGVLVVPELVAAEGKLFFYAGIVGEEVVIFLLCLLDTFLQHSVLLPE